MKKYLFQDIWVSPVDMAINLLMADSQITNFIVNNSITIIKQIFGESCSNDVFNIYKKHNETFKKA